MSNDNRFRYIVMFEQTIMQCLPGPEQWSRLRGAGIKGLLERRPRVSFTLARSIISSLLLLSPCSPGCRHRRGAFDSRKLLRLPRKSSFLTDESFGGEKRLLRVRLLARYPLRFLKLEFMRWVLEILAIWNRGSSLDMLLRAIHSKVIDFGAKTGHLRTLRFFEKWKQVPPFSPSDWNKA